MEIRGVTIPLVISIIIASVFTFLLTPPSLTTYKFLGSTATHGSITAEIVETAPSGLDNPNIRNISDVVLELLSGAENSIDMEVYTIYASDYSPLSDIHSALFSAATRGVQIRILIDNGIYNDLYYSNKQLFDNILANENIQLKTSPWAMHSKVIIVDNQKCLVSSANLSWSAMTSDREIAIYVYGEEFGKALEDIFETGWYGVENSTEFPTGWTIDWIKPVATPTGTPTWTPRTLDVITDLIDSATKTIHVPVYAYSGYPYDLKYALDNAADRKIEIRMIIDAEYSNLNDFPILGDFGSNPTVQIKAANLPSYAVYHTKSIVVDGKRGYVGSANWSNASMTWRREIGVYFDDENLASALEEIFRRDWSSSYVDWVVEPSDNFLWLWFGLFSASMVGCILVSKFRRRKRKKRRREWVAELWASSKEEL